MCAPIDAANSETKSEVDGDDDQGAADISANFATYRYPCAKETEDCTRYAD
jgi:hypothetical protein